MNCSVCGKKRILETSLDLRCDDNYFCELHFPCLDKAGLRTGKFEWPTEQQLDLVEYFIVQLRSKTPERTISGSHLIGDINVVHTDLPGIDLHDVVIFGHLHLAFCSINYSCDLRTLKLNGSLSVQNCTFLMPMRSEDIEISGLVYLVGCNFLGDVHFGGAHFKSVVTFEHSTFSRYSSFRDVVFDDHVSFSDVAFLGYCNFTRAEFKREMICKSAKFHKVTLFEHCKVRSNLALASSTFHRAPLFSGSELSASVDISGTRFLDVTSEDAYPAYKRLRILFSEKRIREGELTLYYLEQKSLRIKSRGTLKVISLVYELISGYGTSIRRALLALFVVNLAFLLLYKYQLHPGSFVENLEYSFKQIFSPFGEWKDSTFTASAGKGIVLKMVTSFQSVLTFVILGFLTLAIRWRFSKGAD